MKTFVLLITVLVAATGAVWLLNRGPARMPARPADAPALVAPQDHGSGSKADQRVQNSAPSESASAAHSGVSAPAPVALEGARTERATPSDLDSAAPAGHNAYHTASAALSTTRPIRPPDSPAPVETLNAAPPGSAEHGPKSSGVVPPAPAGSADPTADTGPKFTLGPETDVKQEEDGWTRLDGRFLVRGAGTKQDPMIVPWELLVSASETYRPRAGLKEMPRRVADLKGKHVRVTGYALFPLMSLETTEVLLMRNQWDGCCIGVPPTPYDAVEVTLAKPADRKDTFVSFVTIEGVLDVDPYVNRDFLLGLYVLKDAALSQPARGKDDEKGL